MTWNGIETSRVAIFRQVSTEILFYYVHINPNYNKANFTLSSLETAGKVELIKI